MKQRELILASSDTCNNRCIFCLDRCNDEWVSPGSGILAGLTDRAAFDRLLDEARPNVERVVFTSAEPTLNERLLEWVGRARDRGFTKIMLVTNGRMLAYLDMCEALVRAGVTDFNISIHGPTKKVHQWHTRTSSSFPQTVKGLAHISSLAEQHPITLKTTSVLTRFNYRHVADLIRLLKRFHPTDATLIPFIPEGNALTHFDRVFVHYREIGVQIGCAIQGLLPLGFPVRVLHLPKCVMSNGSVTSIVEGRLLGENGKIVDRPAKEKRDACASCRHEPDCEGVWKAYTERIGWDEFRPVPVERGATRKDAIC